jgi:hypothetical protein
MVGGAVSFVNAEGNVVEGTREEAVRARYASMPKHSMTKKAVVALKSGSVEGHILKEEEPESKGNETGPITDERRQELLNLSRDGRKVLAQAK